MLQTTNIKFSYNPDTLFRFPDISCADSKTLLITGSSGKGKTTLLHLLAGILKPTAGNININATDITTLKAKKLDHYRGQHIGMVFQQSHFVASLSVLDNVMLAQYLSGRKRDSKQALVLLESLGVASQKNKKPSQLSIGQQQRVSIARALINNPAVLLADEPTSSLDDENCFAVARLLQQQAIQFNTALVIVTHDSRLKQLFHQSIALS
ncbi:MAG: ABC transporter ATP-binding protein [Ferruginibacter sp.]